MAATAANIDSNGRLRMASMAMAEVGLERGSDTTQKQNLAATHAHCTASPAIGPMAYGSLCKSLTVRGIRGTAHSMSWGHDGHARKHTQGSSS